MGKAYSINDEDYIYEDAGEALDALESEGRLVEGAIYYEIDTAVVDLADNMRAEDILERAEESLYDKIGDAAEGAYEVSAEAFADLVTALRSWATKHLSGRGYWRVVGKPREIMVTAADVAEYAR